MMTVPSEKKITGCDEALESTGELDCSAYDKQDLVMEVMRLTDEVSKLKTQREMLQSQLLKYHRQNIV